MFATRPRLVPLVAVAALVVLALAGCAEEAAESPFAADTTTSTTEPTTTDAPTTQTTDDPTTTEAPPDEPGEFTPEPIEWQDCGNAECGELLVPLDYERPDGPTVELLVARAPASGDRV